MHKPGARSKQFLSCQYHHVSTDSAPRSVNFLLQDTDGVSHLAVIGTESEDGRMVYEISDDFIDLVSPDYSTISKVKLESRHEVMEWLKSFISCSNLEGSSSLKQDKRITTSTAEGKCQTKFENITPPVMPVSEISWVGNFWTCGKSLQHYRSFRANGFTIPVHSFIHVPSLDSNQKHLIAYIVDLYEDTKSRKKMKVKWLHRADEIKDRIPPPAPLAREIFMTPFSQVLSVACCDGLVDVLALDHFDQCMSTHHDRTKQAYVCQRFFDKNGVRDFDICNVKGYWSQEILSIAGLAARIDLPRSGDSARSHTDIPEEQGANHGMTMKRVPTAARSSRKRTGRFDSFSTDGSSTPQHEKSCLSNDTADVGAGCGEDFLRVGRKVEILSQDSGLKGCWYRCTVLKIRGNSVLLQYDDVELTDSSDNLQGWYSISEVANADKIRMRVSGRRTIRPSPPNAEVLSRHKKGSAVDAWWHDGWWEGVLTGGKDDLGNVEVYLPDEEEIAWVGGSNVRISRDFVEGQWIDVPRRRGFKKPGKILVSHQEKSSSKQVHEANFGETKMPVSDFESGTSQLSNPLVSKAEVMDGKVFDHVKKAEGKVHGKCRKWVERNSGSGCISYDSCHDNSSPSCPRSLPSAQPVSELMQVDVHRDKENTSAESVSEGLISSISRKRPGELDASLLARPGKLSSREPMSSMVLDEVLELADVNVGMLPLNGKKELGHVEPKCPQYGADQAKFKASSVGGSLFNSISHATLVLSR